MTGRVLGIELRRSAAVWICPLLLVLGTVMQYATIDEWGGRWLNLATSLRECLMLLIPVAVGAAAWQGRRDRMAVLDELLATTPRPARQRAMVTAAALAFAGAVGFLGAFAAGVPQVATTATYFSTAWVPMVAVGTLALVAASLVGLGVGRLWPHRLTPPVAAVVSLVALIVPETLTNTDSGPNVDLLSVARTEWLEEFFTYEPTVHLLQAVEFAGLAATGLLLVAASRPVTRLLAAAPAIAAVAVAAALLPSGGLAAGSAPDIGSYAPVCTTDKPTVCVTRLHARALDDLRGPARQALALLAAKVPGAPTKVAESSTSWRDPHRRPRPPDTVLIEFSVDGDGHLQQFDRANLLWDLLDGAGTRSCDNVKPDDEGREDAAARAVAAWLIGTPPTSAYFDSLDVAVKAYDTLRSLPAAEQQARVVAFRRAALACDGRDLLDILVGKGGRS